MESRGPKTIHPTLIIGLGGTGRDTVKLLKKAFIEEYGQVPELTKFLVFDTTKDTKHITTKDGKEVSLSNVEFKYIGDVDLDKIVSDISLFPTINSWLPEPRRNYAVGNLVDGAGMIRSLGKTCLYWHSAEILKSLTAQMGALVNLKQNERNAQINVNQITVWIIASTCGGTGSGTFMDISYLVSQAAKDKGARTNLKKIGVLLLPGAFSDVLEPSLMERAKANAFATLTELDYEMDHPKQKIKYLGGTEINLDAPKSVFDVVFLIDKVNQNGGALRDNEQTTMMVAENLFLMISTEIGKASSDVSINLFAGARALNQEIRGKKARYSSFGVTSYVYPAGEISRSCKYRLAHLMLDIYLGKGLDFEKMKSNVDREANTILESLNVSTLEGIENFLSYTSEGKKISVPTFNKKFEKLLKAGKISTILKYYDRVDSISVVTEFEKFLENRKDVLESKIIEEIVKKSKVFLNSSDGGLKNSIELFESIKKSLSNIEDEISDKSILVEKSLAELQKKAKRARNLIVEARNSRNFLTRKSKLSNTVAEFAKVYQIFLEAKINKKKLEKARQLVASVKNTIDNKVKELSFVKNNLESLSQEFSSEETFKNMDLTGMDFLLEKSVVEEEDVDNYFKGIIKDVKNELSNFILQMYNSDLSSSGIFEFNNKEQNEKQQLTREKIKEFRQNILDYADSRFRSEFDKKNIETEMSENLVKYKNDSPATWLTHMYDMAAPFWNFNPANLGESHNLIETTIVGVRDANSPLFKEQQVNFKYSPVSLGESYRHRITVQRSSHGLPLFALNSMNEFARLYKVLSSNEEAPPLHSVKEPEEGWPDIMPISQEEKLKTWFVLALKVFNGKEGNEDVCSKKIEKRAVYYYANRDPRKELPDNSPIKLGQGYDNAIESFIRNPELVQEYEKWINDEVKQMGNNRAIQIINSVLNSEKENLRPEERKLILRYRKELEE